MKPSNSESRASSLGEYGEQVLGGRALGWVRHVLDSGKALAKEVLRKQNLQQGTVTVFGPANFDRAKLEDFWSGGVLSRADSRARLIKVLMQGVSGDPRTNGAVFENYLASAKDPWLQRAESNLFFYESDVYHYCGGQVSEEILDLTIAESEELPFFWGMLTRLPSAPLTSRTQVGRSVLEEFAEHASSLVVGAYDGEGYLLWRKAGEVPLTAGQEEELDRRREIHLKDRDPGEPWREALSEIGQRKV